MTIYKIISFIFLISAFILVIPFIIELIKLMCKDKPSKITEYKTRREGFKFYALVLFLSSVIMLIILVINSIIMKELDGGIIALSGYFILSLVAFLYCWGYYYKKKLFFTKGQKFNATIIEARVKANLKYGNKYYLIIEFFENNQRKLRFTNAYEDNPNVVLNSKSCCIYKYRSRYLEGDFHLNKQEIYGRKLINIKKYDFFDDIKVGKVLTKEGGKL